MTEYVNVYLTDDAPEADALTQDDVPTLQGVRPEGGTFDMGYRSAVALLRKLDRMGLYAVAINDAGNVVASTTTIAN